MEVSSKLSEQIAHNTRGRNDEHMLVTMKKSAHKELLYQPLQTKNKQYKVAVTFLTGYSGFLMLQTKENNKLYFLKSVTDEDGYTLLTFPPGAYETESLNTEIKRIIIDEGHYTETNFPFTIKPIFSTLGSFNRKIHSKTNIYNCTR